MVQVTDIHSLTSFLRNHKAHIERLVSTGRPEVLTINGKACVVIQDAEAYQRLLDALHALEGLETERILRERLASIDRGEPAVPASKVLSGLRKQIGAKRK
ncbi:MAG: type II toxin-antitoxin system Phd/YefM family antitoxin [Phycisphaerales bacterium]